MFGDTHAKGGGGGSSDKHGYMAFLINLESVCIIMIKEFYICCYLGKRFCREAYP